MHQKLLFFIFLLLDSFSFGQSIVVTNDNLGSSFSNEAYIVEDKDNKLIITDILNDSSLTYKKIKHSVEIIDFTSSAYWLKFSIVNLSDYENLIIEIARPITNEVVLYSSINNYLKPIISGDDFPFAKKTIKHRKNLFPVAIDKKQTASFIVKLKSDGELIPLPLKIYSSTNFVQTSESSFFNGAYYGILILVIIIFFFFYKLLKEESFKYYVFYIISLLLLQISLDGYAFQYLFPNGGYFANHIVLFSAALTIVFLVLYVKSYLFVKRRFKKMKTLFTGLIILMSLFGALSLIPGFFYEIMFPLINGLSLLVGVIILFCVYNVKKQGEHISNYFVVAFTILLMGAILFILGNFHIITNAEISLNSLKFSSAIEVILLSVSMAYKYKDLSLEKEEAQSLALKNLEEKNKLVDQQNEILEKEVKDRTFEIANQKEILAEKNKEVIDSINYANRLQQALIPPVKVFQSILPDSFILFQPKDILSGDFYWVTEVTTTRENDPKNEKLAVFCVADCTGHGVPGAMMSVIGIKALNQSIKNKEVNTTSEAMDYLNNDLYETVNKHNEGEGIIRDGMDISICALNFKAKTLYYSGANNPIYIIKNGALIELKPDKVPIGSSLNHDPFSMQSVQLAPGDLIYAFTDGYPDQFGGEKGKKLKYKRFKELLLENANQEMNVQKDRLLEEFNLWKGNLEQVDDVCIIGIRV